MAAVERQLPVPELDDRTHDVRQEQEGAHSSAHAIAQVPFRSPVMRPQHGITVPTAVAEVDVTSATPEYREGMPQGGVRTLSVDIGGTGLKAAVLDSGGEMVTDRVRVETEYPCTPPSLTAQLV